MSSVFIQKHGHFGQALMETLTFVSLDVLGMVAEYGKELRWIRSINLKMNLHHSRQIIVRKNQDIILCNDRDIIVIESKKGEIVTQFRVYPSSTEEGHITHIAINPPDERLFVVFDKQIEAFPHHHVIRCVIHSEKSQQELIGVIDKDCQVIQGHQNQCLILSKHRFVIMNEKESYIRSISDVYRGISVLQNQDIWIFNYNTHHFLLHKIDDQRENLVQIGTAPVPNNHPKPFSFSKSMMIMSQDNRSVILYHNNMINVYSIKKRPCPYFLIKMEFFVSENIDRSPDNFRQCITHDVSYETQLQLSADIIHACFDDHGALYVLLFDGIEVYDY